MTAPVTPTISVVIPTHNRRDSVLRLLQGLANGTFAADRIEVVVVADGCTDDTVAALATSRFPFPLQVIEQSPGRGAAHARNRGAKESHGPILLFIDDDIEPLPTLLEAHHEIYTRTTALDGPDRVVVVGAPIPVRERTSGLHHLAVWGWWEQQFERMARPGHRFSYHEVFSGILSMPAALFAAAGGFDPALNSCRDDSELGARLFRHRARVVFTRAAGGWHHEMRNRTQLQFRKRAEGRADVLLAEKHPELWPTLRLSEGNRGPRRVRAVRRAALADWWVGRAFAAGMGPLLDLLEWLKLRGTWRAVHAATMEYNYWRGVADGLGGPRSARAALARLVATRGAAPSNGREIELDLADGLEAAERRLDQEQPDGLRVRLGDIEIGRVPPVAGAEPLRGGHLRGHLAAVLAWPLIDGMALHQLTGGASLPNDSPSAR